MDREGMESFSDSFIATNLNGKGMRISNWMHKGTVNSVCSELSVIEAKYVFDRNPCLFLPVIDKDRLRGILVRRDLRKAALLMAGTQDPHEMEYFNTKLKVKDLMVRKPVTVSVTDTVEQVLTKGEQIGRSFFPVMDGDLVVGSLSDLDMIQCFNQILGIGENIYSLTIEPSDGEDLPVTEIIRLIIDNGGDIHSFFSFKQPESIHKRLFIKLRNNKVEIITSILKDQGYSVEI